MALIDANRRKARNGTIARTHLFDIAGRETGGAGIENNGNGGKVCATENLAD